MTTVLKYFKHKILFLIKQFTSYVWKATYYLSSRYEVVKPVKGDTARKERMQCIGRKLEKKKSLKKYVL